MRGAEDGECHIHKDDRVIGGIPVLSFLPGAAAGHPLALGSLVWNEQKLQPVSKGPAA